MLTPNEEDLFERMKENIEILDKIHGPLSNDFQFKCICYNPQTIFYLNEVNHTNQLLASELYPHGLEIIPCKKIDNCEKINKLKGYITRSLSKKPELIPHFHGTLSEAFILDIVAFNPDSILQLNECDSLNDNILYRATMESPDIIFEYINEPFYKNFILDNNYIILECIKEMWNSYYYKAVIDEICKPFFNIEFTEEIKREVKRYKLKEGPMETMRYEFI